MISFGRKRNSSLVGLDISSTSVKLLELSLQDGRYRVESYGVEPLPANAVVEKNIADIEAVGEAIDRLVARVQPVSRNAAVAVSGSAVITKVIDMDANMNDDERENQIRLDADQYIPYPLAEVNLDFDVVGPSPSNPERVSVLLAASRTENIEQRVDALEVGGLTAKVVDVEALAIERAFALLVDHLHGLPELVAIVDIGHTMTTLHVVKDEQIIYTREQLFGGKQLTEDIQRRYGLSVDEANRAKKEGNLPDDYESEVLRPFMEAVVQQVTRSLQFFFSSSQYNDVDHILLAGGTAGLPGLTEVVTRLTSFPCQVVNPFDGMDVGRMVREKRMLREAPSYLTACGLAMRRFLR